MAVQVANPFGAFMAGREAREAERTQQRQNALLDMQMQNAPREMEQQNALLDARLRGENQQYDLRAQDAERAQTQAGDQKRQGALKQVGSLSQQALASGDPRGFVDAALRNPSYAAIFADAGIDPAQARAGIDSPDFLANLKATATFGEQVSPDAQLRAQEAEKDRTATAEQNRLNRKAQLDVAGMRNQPEQPKLSPTEIKARIDIKNKAPRLLAAERRLDRIDTALESIGKNMLFDGGPMDKFALQYSKQGQELQAAGAQFLAELTALTRVPGIGSQSDLEQRLQALQLPSNEFPPEVNARNSAELRSFINDLKFAYQNPDIGSGFSPQAPPQGRGASGSWGDQPSGGSAGVPDDIAAILNKYK